MIKTLSSSLLTSSFKEFSECSCCSSWFLSQAIRNWISLFFFVRVSFRLLIYWTRDSSIRLDSLRTLAMRSYVSVIRSVLFAVTLSSLFLLFSASCYLSSVVSLFSLSISSFFSFLIFSSLKERDVSIVSLLVMFALSSVTSLFSLSWIYLYSFLRVSVSLR